MLAQEKMGMVPVASSIASLISLGRDHDSLGSTAEVAGSACTVLANPVGYHSPSTTTKRSIDSVGSSTQSTAQRTSNRASGSSFSSITNKAVASTFVAGVVIVIGAPESNLAEIASLSKTITNPASLALDCTPSSSPTASPRIGAKVGRESNVTQIGTSTTASLEPLAHRATTVELDAVNSDDGRVFVRLTHDSVTYHCKRRSTTVCTSVGSNVFVSDTHCSIEGKTLILLLSYPSSVFSDFGRLDLGCAGKVLYLRK